MRTSGDIVEMGWGCQQLQGRLFTFFQPKKNANPFRKSTHHFFNWSELSFPVEIAEFSPLLRYRFPPLYSFFLFPSSIPSSFPPSSTRLSWDRNRPETRKSPLSGNIRKTHQTRVKKEKGRRKHINSRTSTADAGRNRLNNNFNSARWTPPVGARGRYRFVQSWNNKERDARRKNWITFTQSANERTNEPLASTGIE